MVVDDAEYRRGLVAGEIAARLADHDQHLAKINGSMNDVARALHVLTLAVQRLGDQADANAKTVIATASALEKADAARRAQSETSWSPLTRLGVVVGALAALVGIYLALR